MGCWYGRAHWGQGYATEEAAGVLEWVFERMSPPLDAVKSAFFTDNLVTYPVWVWASFVAWLACHVFFIALCLALCLLPCHNGCVHCACIPI
eukprot:SAG11_NODE_906_length_6600_cov_8.505461_2_plen_92_part_00